MLSLFSDGLANQGADFGQGWYNDHHFHYGYIIFGCAIVAKYDQNWAASFQEEILALLRDYANPALDAGATDAEPDVYFTRLRHFDVYASHSWAAGLFVFADGRNQESSSESINAYYAMSLLGTSFGRPDIAAVGKALLTQEILGTNTYWHLTVESSVYPPIFAANKCAGMVWSDKVVEATWFAAGTAYIHGINMLPITPVSEFYLTADWVKEEYPVVFASLTPDVGDDWRGFIWGTHCTIDAVAAWTQIEGLTSFDAGNTRSNLMYFCATRPPQSDVEEEEPIPVLAEEVWIELTGLDVAADRRIELTHSNNDALVAEQ
jgi:endo-1,3(4)-beta-glucanase